MYSTTGEDAYALARRPRVPPLQAPAPVPVDEDDDEGADLERSPAFTPADELNDILSLSVSDIASLESDLRGLTTNFARATLAASSTAPTCTSTAPASASTSSTSGTTAGVGLDAAGPALSGITHTHAHRLPGPGTAHAYYAHAHAHAPPSPPSMPPHPSSLDVEMSRLPFSWTAAYRRAVAEFPGLVSAEWKGRFLECEGNDAAAAAMRLARHWEFRLELFGPDRGYLPMTLAGAMQDEVPNMLQRRVYQMLPVRDAAGRAVIYIDPSRRNFSEYSIEQECMAVFYLLETAAEDPSVRRRGVVFVSDGRNMQRPHYTRKLGTIFATACCSVQPVRMKAFHFCSPSRIANYMIEPIVRYALPRDVRLRFKKHVGTLDSVLWDLESYCLPRDRLPTEMGGT